MDSQTLTHHLNDAQKQAVTESPRHQLIIAGAGSGKTRVLVHRIAWLHHINQIPTYNILAVTFTNKAANSIKSRVEELLQGAVHGMWLGTFHSVCHRLLRMYHKDFGIAPEFQVIDADDQLRMIKSIQKSFQLDDKAYPAKKTQYYISQQKEAGIRASQNAAHDDEYHANLHRVYQEYEKTCVASHLVDFDELILLVVENLTHNEPLRTRLQGQFRHILIDEFQDTNQLQYQFVKLLNGERNFITVVGDDDQSIYSWRGAQVDNILNFADHFPNVQTIRLEQNYRSSACILNAANAVIANNNKRLGKNLWTDAQSGDKVILFTAYNEAEEARYIIDTIQHNCQKDYHHGDHAILYRSNAQSRVLEEHLSRANIPYIVYGGLRFFERAEIKDALAYLRLATNHDDNQAFERIINTPTRGLGLASLDKIKQVQRQHGISMWEASKMCLQKDTSPLSPRTQNALLGFLQKISQLQEKGHNLGLSEWFELIVQSSDLIAHQHKNDPEQAKNKLENLQELLNAVSQYEHDHPQENTLLLASHFIADVTLDTRNPNAKEKSADRCVQLMTLHAAKGLEFDCVFLTGMEEGLFPHKMALYDGREIEEERRLCYVGMTRARKNLHITHAEYRRIYNQENYQRPSRFLQEIPAEFLNPYNQNGSNASSYQTTTQSSGQTQKNTWKLGQTVKHPSFGYGVVLSYEGHGSDARVQVRFENGGVKWLVAEYAKLETL